MIDKLPLINYFKKRLSNEEANEMEDLNAEINGCNLEIVTIQNKIKNLLKRKNAFESKKKNRRPKVFSFKYALEVELSEDNIWPDFDGPEAPDIYDVWDKILDVTGKQNSNAAAMAIIGEWDLLDHGFGEENFDFLTIKRKK